jgi:hypothetical protein
MARPKRKRLEFTEDSVNELLQEIYVDSHNQKAKINRLFTKWETKVKENAEVHAIGDQIVKLIAAEAKNVDQKIVLLRYLKEVVFDKKEGNGIQGGTVSAGMDEEGNVNTNRRNELLNFVADEAERMEKEELKKKEQEEKKKNK